MLNKVLLVGLLLATSACTGLNPLGVADTLEQKSYALYGTFVVFEEQAAELILQPEVPASVKRAIQQADRVAKPSVDQLKSAADTLLAAKRQYDAGTSDKERVDIAVRNLSSWYYEAAPKVRCLVLTVQEKGPC